MNPEMTPLLWVLWWIAFLLALGALGLVGYLFWLIFRPDPERDALKARAFGDNGYHVMRSVRPITSEDPK